MEEVAVVQFSDADVVRHALVTRIVRAYEARDRANGESGGRTRVRKKPGGTVKSTTTDRPE
jgi:phosphate starvation-inducible protein PhoH